MTSPRRLEHIKLLCRLTTELTAEDMLWREIINQLPLMAWEDKTLKLGVDRRVRKITDVIKWSSPDEVKESRSSKHPK